MAVRLMMNPAEHDEALDTWAGSLADVNDAIGKVPKDEFSPDLVAAARKAVTAMGVLHDDVWRAADGVSMALSWQQDGLQAQAEALAKTVPQSGWSGPQEYQAVVAAQKNGVYRVATQSAASAVLKKSGGPIADHANAAAGALNDLVTKHSWAIAQWSAPRALRDQDLQIVDLHRVGAVVRDLKSRANPMRYAIDFLGEAVKSADPKTLQIFSDAALEVASELKQELPTKLAARYQVSRDMLDNERSLAFQLEGAIQRLRNEQRPKSLDAMQAIGNALLALWREIAGASGFNLGTSEFAERYLSDGKGSTGKGENLFELSRDYPAKWLPPRADGPPGWSAPIGGSASRGVMRMGITSPRRF